MSIGSWNTGTDGAAGCKDMPEKSIDIRLTDNPVLQKRGPAPLESFSISMSVVFKVLLSLFFRLIFS